MTKSAVYAYAILCSAFVQFALAQAPSIVSFSGNGTITWTNGVYTNARYCVEWASSSRGPWRETWQSLQELEAHTGSIFSASVPMFYRVSMSTNPWPIGMVCVDAGPFEMGDHYNVGDTDEEPVHVVHVSAFLIDRYLVSNERMRRVMQWAYDTGQITASSTTVQNAYGTPKELLDLDDEDSQIHFTNGTFVVNSGKENFPCVEVSWYGALAYCNYRSDREGLARCINVTNWTCDFNASGYRLPTEAEWEKAARGGLARHHYPWPSYGGNYSNHIHGNMANYANSGDPFDAEPVVRTTPVGYYNGGQQPPGDDMANALGLYDMAGNTRQWCWDWYQDDWYSQPLASASDTTGPATGTMRIHRAGMYNHEPVNLRCANRAAEAPDVSPGYGSFRCVRR